MTDQGNFDAAREVERIRKERADKAAKEAEKRAAEEAEKKRREKEHGAKVRELLHYAEQKLENIDNPFVSEFVAVERWSSKAGFFREPKSHERQTRYYGLWMMLGSVTGYVAGGATIGGLVKLRQPHAGYAYAATSGECARASDDPETYKVCYIPTYTHVSRIGGVYNTFRTFASLEEVIESGQGAAVEGVKQALDFVATGQPPEPRCVPFPYKDW